LSKNGEISPGNNNIGTMQRAPHNHESSWTEELFRFRMLVAVLYTHHKALGEGHPQDKGSRKAECPPLRALPIMKFCHFVTRKKGGFESYLQRIFGELFFQNSTY